MPVERLTFDELLIAIQENQRAIDRLSEEIAAGEAEFGIVRETQDMPITSLSDTTGPEENHFPKPGNCRCEACKMGRFEGSKLRNAVIHEYNYGPRNGWRTKSVPGDPFTYHLGVELETDSFFERNGREEFSTILPEMAADMRRPKNLWVPKHDGSVTGPEFASYPATLTYWQKSRRQINEMFKMLLHAGYRSHDNDACGMHVNISRNAFADPAHLFRFLTLLHASPKWSLRMSQRTLDSASQWAALNLEDPRQRETCVTSGFHRWGHFSNGRYSALNAVSGQPRFEFRLPRGTLRIDRFFKNLEWTVGMIEFSRTSRVKDCTPIEFMDWVRQESEKYPDLAGFIAEKFRSPAARAEAVAVPGNVPENEIHISATPEREVRRSRYGGPDIYTDVYGTVRYAATDDRVTLGDTYLGTDGHMRYVRTGLRVNPTPRSTPIFYSPNT